MKGGMKKLTTLTLVAAIALVGLFVWQKQQAPHDAAKSRVTPSTQSINNHQYSLTDPSSIWVVVNKQRPLNPISYEPADLVTPNVPLRTSRSNDEMKMRSVAASALEQMVARARQDGINLMIASGYRSYSLQTSVYNSYVHEQGRAVADSQSAHPGYSEHQTGLAVDLEPTSRTCEVDACFANTPEGKWLATNSYIYGFILRYPQGLENIVGYAYEPWHFRYIGVPAATEMHTKGVATLEQFFDLGAAPDYK